VVRRLPTRQATPARTSAPLLGRPSADPRRFPHGQAGPPQDGEEREGPPRGASSHRAILSWKAQRGARRYQVLRAGKKPLLLATVKNVQYTDGKAPIGKLTAARYVVRAVLSS